MPREYPCGATWANDDNPAFRGPHHCAQPAGSEHDWHRCACGATEPARLDPYQRSADA